MIVPNKSAVSIVYTNAEKTSGYINDPFFFSNTLVQYTPPTPLPPDDSSFLIDPINQNINQINQQQKILDNQLASLLTIGCF